MTCLAVNVLRVQQHNVIRKLKLIDIPEKYKQQTNTAANSTVSKVVIVVPVTVTESFVSRPLLKTDGALQNTVSYTVSRPTSVHADISH